MFLSSLYAFIGSLGFAIIFNIKGKNLIAASFGGGISWLIFQLCSSAGLSTSTALFTATIIVTIYSEFMAKIMKSPATIFVICSIIPLVPGSGMYYTTFESVNGNFSGSLTQGIKTLFDAGAIAVGIIFVSSIARIFKSKKYKKLYDIQESNKK